MPNITCPLISSILHHNRKGFSKPEVSFFMRDKSAALGHALQCSETQASVTQGSQIAGQEVIKRSDHSRSQGIVLHPIAAVDNVQRPSEGVNQGTCTDKPRQTGRDSTATNTYPSMICPSAVQTMISDNLLDKLRR